MMTNNSQFTKCSQYFSLSVISLAEVAHADCSRLLYLNSGGVVLLSQPRGLIDITQQHREWAPVDCHLSTWAAVMACHSYIHITRLLCIHMVLVMYHR